MKKWMMKRVSADLKHYSEQFNIDPLLARILVNKGLASDEDFRRYLYDSEDDNYNALLMKDMKKATEIICQKISAGASIRIIGDYDVDGVCATAILYKGLKSIGAKVDTVIPHRIYDGYGLNMNIIDKAHEDKIDTIITCDNGISACAEIERAVGYGMTVVVTDHHEVPFETDGIEKKYIIPCADAVVDPKQSDCNYPFDGICGAYVVYKFIEVLTDKWFEDCQTADYDRKALLDELTELAALATVADIMELKGENRNLVKKGLKLMAHSGNEGLKALINVKQLNNKVLNVYHLGFVLGPCINAAGRISSADRALELLLCQDKAEAQRLAADLSNLNETRKKLTEEAFEEAKKDIDKDNLPGVIVSYIPECHESVAGIVAGKLRELYSRPSLVITKGEEWAKGSARSITSYNMYEGLNEVKDIFIKYGGHSQAAGFSLPYDKIDELRRRLNDNIRLTEEDYKETLVVDADPPFSYISPEFVDQLTLMQPVGNGNEDCRLARKNVEFRGIRFMGSAGSSARIRIKDSDGFETEVVLFKGAAEFTEKLKNKYGDGTAYFSVCYTPSWNEFNGKKNIQFVVEDYII